MIFFKKFCITIILSLLSLVTFGQDTTFYNKSWKKINRQGETAFYCFIQQNSFDKDNIKRRCYYASGQIMEEKNYSNYSKKILDGKSRDWLANGQLQSEVNYVNNVYHGKVNTFWKDGTPKRIDRFRKGKLENGKCYTEDGRDTVHFDYFKLAEFPGGEKALLEFEFKNIKYPILAMINQEQGMVKLNVIVHTDGSISNIKIVKSVSKLLDEEAVRLVKLMPKWNPTTIDGEPEDWFMNVPVFFYFYKK